MRGINLRSARMLLATGVLAATVGVSAGAPASAHRDDVVKLDVQILTADVPEPISDHGTFVIEGAAAPYLCDEGTWQSRRARTSDLPDGSFVVKVKRDFTCSTGETFTLKLRNIIVPGEGGVPGEARWRLVDTDGFETRPLKGRGEIVAQPPYVGEDYIGFIKFADLDH